MLTASRERGVIGCREIDAQHPEDRCQDALGLTQRSVEEETERQGGFEGEIGILEWPAPPADASRCPRGDRVRREPEGDVASPHEGSVVLGPVPDAIRCRVLRMHSRLHIEIMPRRRSRWSTCRPLLAHRAESAHQRPARAAALTTYQIRQYQLARRAAGAATGTINRETSALHRMCTLAVHWGWLDTVPGFPDRLRENPPRQGFFEHPEYLAVRAHLPAPWQDILDLAYYSGWRKQEILGLSWDEIDRAGGVIRLSPARSKTLVGRILPISQPIAEALARRRARRDPDSPLVFHRDGITIRRWRTAWRTACQAAGVPTRFLHDCRRLQHRCLSLRRCSSSGPPKSAVCFPNQPDSTPPSAASG